MNLRVASLDVGRWMLDVGCSTSLLLLALLLQASALHAASP